MHIFIHLILVISVFILPNYAIAGKKKEIKRIAVCYWGLIRSLNKCYESHYTHIYNILDQHNIKYDVFVHTWGTAGEQWIWNQSFNFPVNYADIQLLNPKYVQIDNQDEYINSLDFDNTKDIYQNFNREGNDCWLQPRVVLNCLCALASQKRVFEMVLRTGKKYDRLIFVRPDAGLKDPLPIQQILKLKDKDLIVPDFDHCSGWNDRFAIMTLNTAPYYAFRQNDWLEFRQKEPRFSSEGLLGYICKKYSLNVFPVKFDFDLVRP